MADQFSTWQQLLALAQQHKTKAAMRAAITASGIQILETEPFSGYFRCAATKDGPLLPVAIWREGATLHVVRNNEPVKLERVWPYAVWTPVSYDWYEAVAERGEKWPDEHEDRAVETKAEVPAADREVARTDNQPPEESEIDALKREIETASANIAQYNAIGDDDTAAAAQALRSRLNTLSGDADKKREAEKAPHWEKCKEVDRRWQPLVKLAKDGADAIRRLLSAYETEKARKAAIARQEEERRQAEARAKAEAEAAATGKPAPEPEPQPEAPITPVNTGKIRGASGRAATVRVIKVAKVADYDAFYAHVKAFPEVKIVMDKLAQRLTDAGETLPGVTVEEQRDVA